ncbi:MAG: hypothetical protein ACR2JD_01830 [Nocardioides sp.]
MSDYRFSPSLAGRLLGVALALVGALVLVVTLVVAVFRLSMWTVVVVAAAGVAVAIAGWWVTRRAIVVRLDEFGYRVRLVRGVGAPEARWPDVRDAGPLFVAGTACVVLRLRDGRTTTIPVEALDVDGEAFVRDVRDRLARRG